MDAVLMWDQVVALSGRVEHELARALQRGHGIGLSEFRALCKLASADDGELRMQELAERIGLNQSSISRLVGRMESAGLTRRDMCDGDRRGVYSVITDEGRARHAEAAPTYDEALRQALDRAVGDPGVGELAALLTGGARAGAPAQGAPA
ncbi:MarR family winged helix-turn-helix transcriptional regulator [Nocardiopsis halophila]|uniref:MarR family winged helix-turn-helix transcriptional regulator n=1 Tax=Nocardiopsis halophila TaxID=141692 RepID=UPI00034DBA87|nr:MarR family transcriptional regulator [Nocardiopsis halophila]